MLTGGPLGIMQSVMDSVVPYIHDRKQFGQSIGEFQLIQGKVADMYTVLQAGRAFAYTVAKNLDMLGTDHVRQVRKDCASVILWCAEKATWMAGEGLQIHRRQRLHQRLPAGPPLARRQALRNRRRHQRNPPHADRPRAVRRDHVRRVSMPVMHQTLKWVLVLALAALLGACEREAPLPNNAAAPEADASFECPVPESLRGKGFERFCGRHKNR